MGSFILSQRFNGITSIYSNAFILSVYPKGSVSVQRCVCAAQRGPTEQPRAGGCGRTGRARSRTIVLSFIYQNTFIKQIFLPCTFCFLLTPHIYSLILTPLHLLVPFATTFFFHG